MFREDWDEAMRRFSFLTSIEGRSGGAARKERAMNEFEERTQISEAELKALLKREVSRLIDGRIPPEEIDDDEPLFSIPGECESRIELDSLDALELAFAIEDTVAVSMRAHLDPQDLLTLDAILQKVR